MYVCIISTSASVTEDQAYKCEYPVSGLVRFRPEQISAVTDAIPEQ